MSQRFTLFYAGFTAYAPAVYFNQLEFIEARKAEENELLADCISKFSETLKDKAYESSTHMDTAINVAKHLEIEILPKPATYEDYVNWLSYYTECFEKEFPMGRIDHYYFLFARKIAEIISHLDLLRLYVDFMLAAQGSLDLSRKIDKSLKDIEYILFKLMAAAALLSSEPRQNYFNVFYRLMCQEFQAFKEFKVNDMQAAELKKLQTFCAEYNLVVMDGFKKCIGMLKELGI